eukprot:Colp12_sorted_trinity150504_noHs@27759
MGAIAVTAAVVLAYLGLYSAFDKKTKSLKFQLLVDIFSFRRLDFSLKEINKVISLAGLTLLPLAFILPGDRRSQMGLIYSAVVLLMVHSCYSLQGFYGYSFSRTITNNPKRVAIIYGTIAQSILLYTVYESDALTLLLFGGLLFSVLHFYFMETNSAGELQVRPFAYLPFPLVIIAWLWGLVKLF